MSGRPPLIIAWRELLMATQPLTPTDVAVGHALASYMNSKNGECWPAVPSIAAKAHCHPASARRSLRTLESLGLIETEPGGGRHRPNRYRINASRVRAFLTEKASGGHQNPSVTLAEVVHEDDKPPLTPLAGKGG